MITFVVADDGFAASNSRFHVVVGRPLLQRPGEERQEEKGSELFHWPRFEQLNEMGVANNNDALFIETISQKCRALFAQTSYNGVVKAIRPLDKLFVLSWMTAFLNQDSGYWGDCPLVKNSW